MNDIQLVLLKVLALFVMIIPAFILKKRSMVSDKLTGDISTLLLYVVQPLLTIHAFTRPFDKSIVNQMLLVLLMSFIIHTLFYLGSLFLFRKTEEGKAKVLRFITIFSNAGYMCFPILYVIFGEIGILYGSIYCVIFNIFVWTAGVTIFRRDARAFSVKNILFNPASVSTFIAFLIFVFSLYRYIPVFVDDTFSIIGQMTAPLSMFLIGIRLAGVKWKGLFTDTSMFVAIAIRLFIAPIIVLLIAKLFGFTGFALAVPFISSAMPAATSTAIFAEKLNANSEYASKCIVISTMLSILTIPLMLLLYSLINSKF